MFAGDVLHSDESVTSANGRYTFTYQADGNLVLYRNSDHRALWASNTAQSPVGVTIMQADGNLVVYNRFNKPVYIATRFPGIHLILPGAHLIVQDDGNAVIYASNGQPVWATNTVQR